jgi:hypothetical protein
MKEYVKSVSDYINFITSVKYLNKKLLELRGHSDKSLKKFLLKQVKLNKELDKFILDLRGTVEKLKIEDKTIQNIFTQEIDLMQSGLMPSLQSREEKLLVDVYGIFNRIKEIGEEERFLSFAKVERGNWNLSIDSFIKEYEQENERHNEERETEIWGYWDYLSLIPKTLSFIETQNFRGYGDDLDVKDKKLTDFFVSILHAIHTKDDKFNRQVEIKKTIKEKLDRIHVFLLKGIDETIDSKFWTKTGLLNVLNSDVSAFLSSILSAVVSAVITYFVMKYVYGV